MSLSGDKIRGSHDPVSSVYGSSGKNNVHLFVFYCLL